MNIVRDKSTDRLIESACTELSRQIVIAKQESRPILLLLSGGSSLKLLVDLDLTWLSTLKILVLDERFSNLPNVNNSLMINSLRVPVQLSVPHSNETLSEFAARFESILVSSLYAHPNVAVICTFGIGEDGHLAGISPFPNQPDQFARLFEVDTLVAGYTGLLQPPERVTVTCTMLRKHLTHGIVFVTGEKKRVALSRVLAPVGQLCDTPARLFLELSERITLFTDLEDIK